MKKRSKAPLVPSGVVTPAELNKLIQLKAVEYIDSYDKPAGPLPERMRKMLAQPGFLFKRQAE